MQDRHGGGILSQLKAVHPLHPLPMSEPIIAHSALGAAVTRVDSAITVHDASVLATERLDGVVRDAVFGEADARDYARWLL